MLLNGKQIRDGSISDAKLANPSGRPTSANKDMAASTTSGDGDVACATTLAFSPKGTVDVRVNGQSQRVGDGVKTKDCYFSGDGGTTARAISAIVAADQLYWVGSIAGFQLDAATDRIDFFYNA